MCSPPADETLELKHLQGYTIKLCKVFAMRILRHYIFTTDSIGKKVFTICFLQMISGQGWFPLDQSFLSPRYVFGFTWHNVEEKNEDIGGSGWVSYVACMLHLEFFCCPFFSHGRRISFGWLLYEFVCIVWYNVAYFCFGANFVNLHYS